LGARRRERRVGGSIAGAQFGRPAPAPARYKLTPPRRKVFAAQIALPMAEQEGDAA